MRRLGEYELLQKIGTGGMGEVWMGRRAALGGASKTVAVKLLTKNVTPDTADSRKMFFEEVRLSMLLTNSNVVQVFDVGEVDGECFMVMEWVDGLNLFELMVKGPALPTHVAAHVINEVLRGLAYAHGLQHDGGEATIVHRDVSPQNVLCSVSGEVKLADFGVARLASEETSRVYVKGKLRYMPPEQLRGQSREATVDLYAVGAIFYELLSGRRFRKTADQDLVLAGEYSPLPVDVPPELAVVCTGLLEADPKQRIQTAEAALDLLAKWPGYRNAGTDLAHLVRKHSGIAGPRSGIQPTPEAPPTVVLPAPGAPDADAGQVDTAIETEPLVTSDSDTHTVARVREETQPLVRSRGRSGLPEVGSVGGSSGTRGLWMTVFGLVSVLAIAWAWTEWGTNEVAIAEPTGIEPDSSEPSTSSGPEVSSPPSLAEPIEPIEQGEVAAPIPDPDRGSDQFGLADPAARDTVDGPVGVEPDVAVAKVARPEPVVDRTPAVVEFSTGEFVFVFIKVNGKTYPLEPLAKVELKPGRQAVQFRVAETDKWQSAGYVRVEAGKRYKAKMLKSGSVKLEAQ